MLQDMRSLAWLTFGSDVSPRHPFVCGEDSWGGHLHSKLSLYDMIPPNLTN